MPVRRASEPPGPRPRPLPPAERAAEPRERQHHGGADLFVVSAGLGGPGRRCVRGRGAGGGRPRDPGEGRASERHGGTDWRGCWRAGGTGEGGQRRARVKMYPTLARTGGKRHNLLVVVGGAAASTVGRGPARREPCTAEGSLFR